MAKRDKGSDKKYKSLEKALGRIGYEDVGEFVEVACALSVLIKEDLPKAMTMAESFSLHCGYILNEIGHIEKVEKKLEQYEKDTKPELKIDMSNLLKEVKK